VSNMASEEVLKKRLDRLYKDAKVGGYTLNPDAEFVYDLTEGLVANDERYGFEACPCRLVEGDKAANLDIICPCVYRDDDLAEYGACFCALYVSPDYNHETASQVPERRPLPSERKAASPSKFPGVVAPLELSHPVWRCTVCGYLCANAHPPGKCPVCKVTSDRFERFM
jgi:ferredoxin-thioredoxin reductase catalytic chain